MGGFPGLVVLEVMLMWALDVPMKLREEYRDIIRFCEKRRLRNEIEALAKGGRFKFRVLKEITMKSVVNINFITSKNRNWKYRDSNGIHEYDTESGKFKSPPLNGWNLEVVPEEPDLSYETAQKGYCFMGNNWIKAVVQATEAAPISDEEHRN